MEITEEKVLELREERKKNKYNSIETGFYVQGEIMLFIRKSFYDNKWSMFIPNTFINMPRELAKIKYPGEQRPQLIYTNLGLDNNLCMTMYHKNFNYNELEIYINKLRKFIVYADQSIQLLKYGELQKGYWFDFRSKGLDEPIYNLIFITKIKDELLQINFNCLFRNMNEWQRIIIQMLESILF